MVEVRKGLIKIEVRSSPKLLAAEQGAKRPRRGCFHKIGFQVEPGPSRALRFRSWQRGTAALSCNQTPAPRSPDTPGLGQQHCKGSPQTQGELLTLKSTTSLLFVFLFPFKSSETSRQAVSLKGEAERSPVTWFWVFLPRERGQSQGCGSWRSCPRLAPLQEMNTPLPRSAGRSSHPTQVHTRVATSLTSPTAPRHRWVRRCRKAGTRRTRQRDAGCNPTLAVPGRQPLVTRDPVSQLSSGQLWGTGKPSSWLQQPQKRARTGRNTPAPVGTPP